MCSEKHNICAQKSTIYVLRRAQKVQNATFEISDCTLKQSRDEVWRPTSTEINILMSERAAEERDIETMSSETRSTISAVDPSPATPSLLIQALLLRPNENY